MNYSHLYWNAANSVSSAWEKPKSNSCPQGLMKGDLAKNCAKLLNHFCLFLFSPGTERAPVGTPGGENPETDGSPAACFCLAGEAQRGGSRPSSVCCVPLCSRFWAEKSLSQIAISIPCPNLQRGACSRLLGWERQSDGWLCDIWGEILRLMLTLGLVPWIYFLACGMLFSWQ